MTQNAAPPSALIDFEPACCRARHDGWTAQRQRAFIEALAECAVVSVAARMVGMSARSAYKLRKRPEAASFSDAWDRALEIGRLQLIDRAVDHATNGRLVPYFYGGLQRGSYRHYDTRVLLKGLRLAEREVERRRSSSTTSNG